MKIAVTATQKGLSVKQLAAAAFLLRRAQIAAGPGAPLELHMGDCIGGDVQVAAMARMLGYRVIAHPPIDPKKRAFFPADESREPLGYMERNQALVDECDELLAFPRQRYEIMRSGTWSTVRRARAAGKTVRLELPGVDIAG